MSADGVPKMPSRTAGDSCAPFFSIPTKMHLGYYPILEAFRKPRPPLPPPPRPPSPPPPPLSLPSYIKIHISQLTCIVWHPSPRPRNRGPLFSAICKGSSTSLPWPPRRRQRICRRPTLFVPRYEVLQLHRKPHHGIMRLVWLSSSWKARLRLYVTRLPRPSLLLARIRKGEAEGREGGRFPLLSLLFFLLSSPLPLLLPVLSPLTLASNPDPFLCPLLPPPSYPSLLWSSSLLLFPALPTGDDQPAREPSPSSTKIDRPKFHLPTRTTTSRRAVSAARRAPVSRCVP
ncbi:hypothetical protein BJ875DRAFT_114142 [Amylocarpus encephaloides]|uniref:Uncharacterized protein n=1 Tax=Amylocarpus encephaloides TaxID=45428 RepID=A0A9P8C8L1_9HELO|nr:hypothetical protein BJ875DRAFT_114142 [Amylocarpus encephaloides]